MIARAGDSRPRVGRGAAQQHTRISSRSTQAPFRFYIRSEGSKVRPSHEVTWATMSRFLSSTFPSPHFLRLARTDESRFSLQPSIYLLLMRCEIFVSLCASSAFDVREKINAPMQFVDEN